MKTQKNSNPSPSLRTRNKRWKWMAGATAATAVGVSASQAGLITITLSNNYTSATGGNHLNADLTGDGMSDLTIAGAVYFYTRPTSGYSLIKAWATVDLNGIHAYAYFDGYPIGALQLGSRKAVWYPPYYPTASLTGSIPLSFKDLHINGGVLTEGSLQVTVSVFGLHGLADIQLDSLTYNSRNNIPDQGSSLALLAMGAGGILALRRWRAAQERA